LVTHPEYDSASKLRRALKHEKENELLKPIIEKLEKNGFLKETVALGDQKYMGICRLDESKLYHKIDIRLIPKDEYYFGILHMTGSQGFNEYMRRLAKDKGYKLNEYSLRKLDDNGQPSDPIHVNSEEEIFEKLSMEYKKPEERSI
jgi:DNA polymerase beta